jgi:hypothetical protein
MSAEDSPITLQLTPDTMQAHCLFAIQQARNTSHSLASLIALQSFIAAMAQASDLNTPAFGVIKGIINGHISNLRTALQDEQVRALDAALRATDCAAITKIHLDLSRNAFWQSAQTAMQELDEKEITRISDWVQTWHTNAQARALAASGYPDALNFKKAGISVQEYTAMTDLNNCLQNANVGDSSIN